MNLIQIKDLSFDYPTKKETLKHINIDVNQGTFTCIVGENGSGKSTLVKCILGLNKGYTGEIIKPFKKKKYALTLKNLMQDIQYREYLSRNAFKQVKKFDIKPIVNKWELLFRSLE